MLVMPILVSSASDDASVHKAGLSGNMLRFLQATKRDGCQALSHQAQVCQAMKLTDTKLATGIRQRSICIPVAAGRCSFGYSRWTLYGQCAAPAAAPAKRRSMVAQPQVLHACSLQLTMIRPSLCVHRDTA